MPALEATSRTPTPLLIHSCVLLLGLLEEQPSCFWMSQVLNQANGSSNLVVIAGKASIPYYISLYGKPVHRTSKGKNFFARL